MHRPALILLAAGMLLLALTGCGDDYPPPYLQYSSIRMDGTGLHQNDTSLMLSEYGKAFYLSDDTVFLLGARLVRRSLTTGVLTPLSAHGSVISDQYYLAIDRARNTLYYAADGAICKVGFGGESPAVISPAGETGYSAPALSDCGNYLTAVRDGRIMRYSIGSGDWTAAPEVSSAHYAVYISAEDQYFFFSRTSPDEYTHHVALCRIDAATQDSTLLMIAPDMYPYGNDGSFAADVSADRNTFAMQFVSEPEEVVGMFDTYWVRYPHTLYVYDRTSGVAFTIQDVFCHAFVPDSNALIYSRLKYGMADITITSTHATSMVWDGYYEKERYSYSITAIYPRADGQVMHFEGWKRSNRKIVEGKGFTAPEL